MQKISKKLAGALALALTVGALAPIQAYATEEAPDHIDLVDESFIGAGAEESSQDADIAEIPEEEPRVERLTPKIPDFKIDFGDEETPAEDVVLEREPMAKELTPKIPDFKIDFGDESTPDEEITPAREPMAKELTPKIPDFKIDFGDDETPAEDVVPEREPMAKELTPKIPDFKIDFGEGESEGEDSQAHGDLDDFDPSEENGKTPEDEDITPIVDEDKPQDDDEITPSDEEEPNEDDDITPIVDEDKPQEKDPSEEEEKPSLEEQVVEKEHPEESELPEKDKPSPSSSLAVPVEQTDESIEDKKVVESVPERHTQDDETPIQKAPVSHVKAQTGGSVGFGIAGLISALVGAFTARKKCD